MRKEKLIEKKTENPSLKQLLSQLGNKKFDFLVFLTTGGFLTGLFEGMIGLSLPLYLSKLGFNISEVGIIIGLASLLSILGLLFLGKKPEDVKKDYALIFTTFLIGFSVFAIIFIQSMVGIILLIAVFTIGRAGGLNIARSFISENLSKNIRATGMAIVGNTQHIGRIAGPFFAGLLIDFVNIKVSFIFIFIVAAFGIISLIIHQRKQRSPL